MYCEKCGQRPAQVHLVEIVNGRKSEAHLCAVCAGQTGGTVGLPIPGGMLSDFIGAGGAVVHAPKRCPQCGLSFNEFISTGLLGCGECYDVFYDELKDPINRLQGSLAHIGRTPETSGDDKLRTLREQLKEAVEGENYERAAELRDAIQDIKRGEANE